jgi:hypothetical protein
MIILDLLLSDCITVNHWDVSTTPDADDEDFAVIRAIASHEAIGESEDGQTATDEQAATWPFPTTTVEGAAEVARKTLTLKPRTASSTKAPARTITLASTVAYTAP